MRRLLALLILIAALAPGTWLRDAPRKPSRVLDLRFVAQELPKRADLGPFKLDAIWQLRSPHDDFGSYSALVPLEGGRLLALSDRGFMLGFSPPGAPPSLPFIRPIYREQAMLKANRDAEAATIDFETGAIWIAWEGRNAISRHDRAFSVSKTVEPAVMRDWGANSGPEAMVRLADGRFIVLREGFDRFTENLRHRALIFPDDPVGSAQPDAFTFAGPSGFSPTDMAELPDGRVLILARKVVWPMPPRFAGRIVLADPAKIRVGRAWSGTELARISASLPGDNFEGMAVETRKDGTLTVWLISDDNGAVTQRTLLWKLALDPADLPWSSKKARGESARFSEKLN